MTDRNLNISIDGILRAPNGEWFSFAYDLWNGRVVRITVFNHRGDTQPVDVFFIPNQKGA